jgi:hypothetical protein
MTRLAKDSFWRSRLGAVALVMLSACKPTPLPESPPQATATTPQPSVPPSQPAPPPPVPLTQALQERSVVLRDNEQFRRTLKLGFGFEESTSCTTPPALTASDLDVNKSLFVHDRATLDGTTGPSGVNFTLRTTLGKLAAQAVNAGATGETAESLFVRLWDSQNPSPGFDALAAHCDLDGGQVNGFPNSCRTSEGAQASSPAQMDEYRAIGLVNRMDLAHEGWRNCGEHRIVYGHEDRSRRNFIIFEAVLPNPKPGCQSMCQPVAEFWASLSDSALTPAQRAEALSRFYYEGLPGFRPVVHIDHYTAKGVSTTYGSSGSGQIRTNQFTRNSPWTLKEFRLALDCGATPCALAVVPTMVKVNPFGTLWTQEVSDVAGPFQARAQEFQADFVSQIARLTGKAEGICPSGGADINSLGYAVDLNLDAAQSQVREDGGPPDHYLTAYNPGGAVAAGSFRDLVRNSPDACGLTDAQIVNRALAQSCAGCHQPTAFGLTGPNRLGPLTTPSGADTRFPDSLGFVHVSDSLDSAGVHPLSPALTGTFLPARLDFMVEVLNAPACTCKRKFSKLQAGVIDKARLIEKRVLDRFEPRVRGEFNSLNKTRRTSKIVPQKTLGPSAAKLATLDRDRDKAIVDALAKANITMEPVAPDLRVQSLKLDAAQRARGDKNQEAQLRQQAVLEQVRAEPARRTVTGHFRVH